MHPAGPLIGIIILMLCILFILYLRSEWEKRHFRTEFYSIKSDKALIGARFIFLSDMHSHEFGEENEELISEIDSLEPDCILIGGDMITCGKIHEDPPRTSACIHLCEELAKRYKVIYAEGNHELRFRNRFPEDYQIFMEHLLQNPNLEYICDDMVSFFKESRITEEVDEFDIYGVGLEMDYYMRQKPGFGNKKAMPEGYLENKLGQAMREAEELSGRRFSILLMHSPLYLKEASRLHMDLVLSGHFHGGTIRIPGAGGLMTPQLQFFVKECAGEIEEDGTRMVVSRGLGTHSVKIRLLDRPEISVIDILPMGGGSAPDYDEL